MDDAVESYLTELARTEHEDPVLVEMEARAAEHGFPIVGRATGRFLELAARAVGARRVMELGSGYGYSAYWFARAVGRTARSSVRTATRRTPGCAEDYLTTAGMWARVRYRVGDALDGFAEEAGRLRRGVLRRRQGGLPRLLACGARPHPGRRAVAV